MKVRAGIDVELELRVGAGVPTVNHPITHTPHADTRSSPDSVIRGAAVVRVFSVPLLPFNRAKQRPYPFVDALDNNSLRLPVRDFSDEKLWVDLERIDRDPQEVQAAHRFNELQAAFDRPVENGILPPKYIHRTAQAAAENLREDPLLYSLYARMVTVLGMGPADQIFAIYLEKQSNVALSVDDAAGTLTPCDVSLFAILKTKQPSREEYRYFDFSPVVSIVGIFSVPLDADDDIFSFSENMLMAKATSQGLTANSINEFLRNRFTHCFLRRFKSYDTDKSLYDSDIRIGALEITSFTGYVFDIDKEAALSITSEVPRHDIRRHNLLLRLQRLLAPGYFFREAGPTRHIDPECDSYCKVGFKDFVRRYLPVSSNLVAAPNSLGILCPGRRVSLIYGDDDGQRHFRLACAWNALVLSLVSMQEGLLSLYHGALADPEHRLTVHQLEAISRAAIIDFGDYFDVGMFYTSRAAFFREAYEKLQKTNHIDHQYQMFNERLRLQLAAESAASAQIVKETQTILKRTEAITLNLRFATVLLIGLTIISIIVELFNAQADSRLRREDIVAQPAPNRQHLPTAKASAPGENLQTKR